MINNLIFLDRKIHFFIRWKGKYIESSELRQFIIQLLQLKNRIINMGILKSLKQKIPESFKLLLRIVLRAYRKIYKRAILSAPQKQFKSVIFF